MKQAKWGGSFIFFRRKDILLLGFLISGHPLIAGDLLNI
jgi:hypothetical protein